MPSAKLDRAELERRFRRRHFDPVFETVLASARLSSSGQNTVRTRTRTFGGRPAPASSYQGWCPGGALLNSYSANAHTRQVDTLRRPQCRRFSIRSRSRHWLSARFFVSVSATCSSSRCLRRDKSTRFSGGWSAACRACNSRRRSSKRRISCSVAWSDGQVICVGSGRRRWMQRDPLLASPGTASLGSRRPCTTVAQRPLPILVISSLCGRFAAVATCAHNRRTSFSELLRCRVTIEL